MVYDMNELRSLAILARDGELGSIFDLYFGDDTWTIRYLVVDVGGWLERKTVLISPRSVERIDMHAGTAEVALTRDQVKASPDYDSEKPVSRQYETELAQYHNQPFYWTGPYLWGVTDRPVPPGAPVGAPMNRAHAEVETRVAREREDADPHLRSGRELAGYSVEATDGKVGHVDSLLFEDGRWTISAVVVDTRSWWPGGHVVISPRWIEAIDWTTHTARAGVTRERIKASAAYDPSAAYRDREARIQAIVDEMRLGAPSRLQETGRGS